ncbi:uncharacterized protein LOC135093483 [Scylla paramamosain]|uniref:uncharacterized protein LOC135093483 n=1 Tax=Scylla paramamosain TaxID=85552 RepID=UPI003082EC11
MVSRSASALPSAELSTPSIPAPPRPWGGSSPSGGVNTWVISAVSGEQQPGQDNHHLAHQTPSPSTAGGCLHRDAHTNANQLISHTSRSARLPRPLAEPGLQDFPAPHVNLRHNNVPSSSSRDTSHLSSLTRPSGEHFLNETRVSSRSGSSSEAKLGHTTTAASTRPQKVSQDDDSLAADSDTSRGTAGVHTRDTRTGDDHTVPGHISKASVKSSHAAHSKHEMWKGGGGGGDGEERGKDIDFPAASPIIRHTKPPLSTVLPEHNRHALSLLVSDEPDSTLMTKNKSLNNISRSGGNSEVYEADALLSKTWKRGSEGPAQEAPPTALAGALAAENGQKKAKNSLFRVGRADREAGREGGSPGVLLQQREKREAEGTRKNEFVVADAGANEGQLDMAAGQGQGGGAAFGEIRKTAAAECRETDGNCAAENRRQKTQKWSRIRGLPASPPTWDSQGVSPRAGGEDGDDSAVVGGKGRVKRWSSVLHSYNNLPPGMYSRVFPGSFPRLYSSYHPAADPNMLPRAEALQGGEEGGAGDTLLPRGSQVDGRYERKSSRASGVHAGRSSSRAKGSNKHVKGERGFTKAPQQRHARSRNRAKRKGEC